ncbi:MAG: hypothetical protein WDZ93_01500 [Candidatus Paceibacterota bacterium]
MKYAVGGLLVLVVVLATVLIFDSISGMASIPGTVSESDIEQVASLTDQQAPFNEFIELFKGIAAEKGGVYAFSLMKVAPFPFGLDQHLLGHEVGEIMYEQEGIDGMAHCTHDFRNACSHTMVIGALLEFGEGALSKIREACHNAPGGDGAYTMCFHGLGHGVLAYNAYEMDRTIAMCGKFGTDEFQQQEAVECFGGAIMEIIGGGGHDPENWRLRRDEYLKTDDPFGLCTDDIVPENFRQICYIYMTPFAFEAFGADMARPSPDVFEKTFELCDEIPMEETGNRWACFGGLGKEFIGIATGRDFVAEVPRDDHLETMYEWCLLAEPEDGRAHCVSSTVDSLYWGGEKPYEAVVNYCALVNDAALVDDCYRTGIRNVMNYNPDPAYRSSFCAALPDSWQPECTDVLGV